MNSSWTVPDAADAGAAIGDAHAPPKNALAVGRRLAHFVIERVIASSDYGFVYQAGDTLLGRKVAIKEYFPQALCVRDAAQQMQPLGSVSHGSIAGGREAFVEEARLLSRLDHAGLVQVLAAFEANHTAYRVMPFHEGVSLAQARREQSHAPSSARLGGLLLDLLSAVEALHKAGVVHGYLHPEQVMLLPDDRVLLLGFGTARRALHAPLDHAYAPLEQSAMGGHLPRGAWTDLYSVAALTWFFATGRAPVPSTERNAGLRFNAGGELTRALGLGGGDGERDGVALVATVDRALTLVPAGRWQSASEMRVALGGTTPRESSAPKEVAPEAPASAIELDPAVRMAIAQVVDSIPDAEPLWASAPAHEGARQPPARAAKRVAPAPHALSIEGSELWQPTRPGVPFEAPASHDTVPAFDAPLPDLAHLDDAQANAWQASRAHGREASTRRSAGRPWMWTVAALFVALGGVAAWHWQNALRVARDELANAEPVATLAGRAAGAENAVPAVTAPAQASPASAPIAPPGTAASSAAALTPPPAVTAVSTVAPPQGAARVPGGSNRDLSAVEGDLPPTAAGPAVTAATAATVATVATAAAPASMPAAQLPPVPTQAAQTPPTQSQPTQSQPTQTQATQPQATQPQATQLQATQTQAPRRTTRARLPVAPQATTPHAAPMRGETVAKTHAREPRELCAGRSNFSLLYCMQTQCKKPLYETSEQCRTLRRTGEAG
jgi:hypothetical protein